MAIGSLELQTAACIVLMIMGFPMALYIYSKRSRNSLWAWLVIPAFGINAFVINTLIHGKLGDTLTQLANLLDIPEVWFGFSIASLIAAFVLPTPLTEQEYRNRKR